VLSNLNEFDSIKQKALKYICLSKKTEFEVRKKLSESKVSYDMIDKVINYLKDLDYINDENYVKSFISQNKKFLKYSIAEIKNKLKIKGIDENVYGIYLNDMRNIKYDNLVISKILNKRNKSLEELKGYLYRRGFDING
jgi:regulatory protein